MNKVLTLIILAALAMPVWLGRASPQQGPSQRDAVKAQGEKQNGARSRKEVDSGEKTATGKKIYVGPRGGRYHYSKSGRKVYERKRKRK